MDLPRPHRGGLPAVGRRAQDRPRRLARGDALRRRRGPLPPRSPIAGGAHALPRGARRQLPAPARPAQHDPRWRRPAIRRGARPAAGGLRAVTLGPRERAVAAAIDAGQVERDLAALVAIPSVDGTPGELEAQRWCADRLRELGLVVDEWDVDVATLSRHPDF